jgi:hypothetical protein
MAAESGHGMNPFHLRRIEGTMSDGGRAGAKGIPFPSGFALGRE